MAFSLEDILNFRPIPGLEDLTVSRILFDAIILLLIFALTRVAIWFVQKLLDRKLFYFRRVDEGKKFAIKQIAKYLIYAVAIAIVFDRLHIGSIMLTSFAGLFVGLGFGVQQTFNDLTSGLILLFEGSVKVGDIVKVDDWAGRVTSIGVRYSVLQTRDDVVVIVPNSKLIVDKVTNYSGNTSITRFAVRVGVAYGSNVELVREKLLEAVENHPDIISDIPDSAQDDRWSDLEPPHVFFQDFGDNSLVFDVFFWTRQVWDVDRVRSDIRFAVDRLFRQHNITIAFPQRDVHLKIDDKYFEKMNFSQNCLNTNGKAGIEATRKD
ncbi:MAG: mechanosensitive ion channel [Bacteroidia bacterium]|nr:mechanosensitive ion channel [Bacteroidia bacterium]